MNRNVEQKYICEHADMLCQCHEISVYNGQGLNGDEGQLNFARIIVIILKIYIVPYNTISSGHSFAPFYLAR